MNRTVKALIARGLSSDKAEILVGKGETLQSLKLKTEQELKNMGLDKSFVETILNESRPAIPSDTVNLLLYESRYCCCVCRDATKPIVIHHLEPWEISHSHNKDNLVVLCSEHHVQAHTKSEMTQNLTSERLRAIKSKWLNEVRQKDTEIINNLANSEFACWNYFNVLRIYELIEQMDIDYTKLSDFQKLRSLSIIDERGKFLPTTIWQVKPTNNSYWLNFLEGTFINAYMGQIVLQMVALNHFKILNDIWNKEDIKSNLRVNDFVLLQGAFYFKKTTKQSKSEGQMRIGYRKYKDIKIEFTFDAYYCTSSSAYCCHLSGKKIATLFAIVREITYDKKITLIRVTALSLGSFSNTLTEGRSPLGIISYCEEDD